MTKKIIISLGVVTALVFGVLYGKGLLSVHQGLEPPPSLSVLALEKTPKAAPDVHFADGAGNTHALKAFQGRYVLVNLWATWCAPCVSELPSLARLSRFAPGLKVVAINTDTTKVDAVGFLKSHDAGALPAREEALRDQAVQRLAHRDPRDAKLVRKLALRRKGVIRRKHLALDGFTQDTLQLPIERRVILLIDAADAVSETTQDILRIAAVRDKTETI